jgi:hypothetical protein
MGQAKRVRPKAPFECGQRANPKGCPRPCGVGRQVVHTGNYHRPMRLVQGGGSGGGAGFVCTHLKPTLIFWAGKEKRILLGR